MHQTIYYTTKCEWVDERNTKYDNHTLIFPCTNFSYIIVTAKFRFCFVLLLAKVRPAEQHQHMDAGSPRYGPYVTYIFM